MAAPTFDAAKHDLGLNGKGYVVVRGARVQRMDAVPVTARAAEGEGRYDSWQYDSFVAQSTFEGGVGQGRLVAQDSFLIGYGDGTFQGHFFPARARQAEANGGSASWYFTRQPLAAAPILYGIRATTIELIGTATTRARTAGTIQCKPVVSGSQNVFWTQGTAGSRALYYWDGATADAPTDITSRLAGATDVCVAARYERGLWALGLGTPSSVPAVAQSVHTSSANVSSASITFDTATTPGNLLVLGVFSEDAGTPTPQVLPEGRWTRGPSDAVTGAAMGTMFYWPNAPQTSSINMDFAEVTTNVRIVAVELSGCSTTSALDASDTVTRTASQNMATPTVSASTTNSIAIAMHFTDGGGTGDTTGYTNSYTELRDQSSTASELAVSYKVLNASGNTSTAATTTATAGNIIVLIAVFKATSTPSGSTMFKAWRSVDEGATWTDIFPTTSTGIAEPRAARAFGGFLYFTTATGLYALAAEEHEFEDHQKEVIVAIKGPLDEWDVPYSVDTVAPIGKHLTLYNGLLYYNVGATVRFYAPNGSGQQLWPPPTWDTVVGEVRHVLGGEGGLYFSVRVTSQSTDYDLLLRYNGRSFMVLLGKQTAGELDYLHWFQGKLYATSNPSSYYNFKYPSSRPDAAGLAVADFTTGYVVSSKLDFEKVVDYKVVRRFETQAEFTATSASGTITLEYRNADSGRHPDPFLPDDSTISWTSIGTHTISDGNVKQYTLVTPAEVRSIWLRATVAVGVSGYPILETIMANGRAIMPALHRFAATLDISTDAKDRAGTAMYTGAAEVNAAIDELQAVLGIAAASPPSPRYCTLDYVDDDNSVTQYVVTKGDGCTDTLMEHGHIGATNPQLAWRPVVSLVELP